MLQTAGLHEMEWNLDWKRYSDWYVGRLPCLGGNWFDERKINVQENRLHKIKGSIITREDLRMTANTEKYEVYWLSLYISYFTFDA